VTEQRSSSITIAVAAATWALGWLGGNVLASVFLAASGHAGDDAADRPLWVSALTAVCLWIPQLVALVVASRRYGTADVRRDLRIAFRPVDVIGFVLGALTQLAVLPALYWPLREIWPDTFSTHALEKNARELYDRADGVWMVVLVAMVVVAAPLVEELVYRGLIQGALRRRLPEAVAWLGAAAFFALIHFRPVEYPGLFAFALVTGACFALTGRIGMSMAAHVGFNATALILLAA
jgi:membrane protease YdiL (CAAX protease family)